MKTTPPAEYYTVAEVAARLRCSKMTVYRMTETGELPGAMRLGPKMVRVHIRTFDAWLAGQHSGTESASA